MRVHYKGWTFAWITMSRNFLAFVGFALGVLIMLALTI